MTTTDSPAIPLASELNTSVYFGLAMPKDHSPSIPALGKETLKPGDLQRVTGLSYRQINEWDNRGALPHQRERKGGWRRLNVWQAMAVRIVAELRNTFGIPLAKQRDLLQWMIGNSPSEIEKLWFYSAYYIIRHLGVSGLVEGGLSGRDAEDLYGRVDELWDGKRKGIEAQDDLVRFSELASGVENIQIRMELGRMGSALLPLYSLLGGMTTGFPMFLITDLDTHIFLDELSLAEATQRGQIFETAIVMRADPHANAVLQAAGLRQFPTKLPAADIEPKVANGISESESKILEALREGDFDQLILEPGNGGYRMVIGRNRTEKEIEAIKRIYDESDYQTITITKSDGRMVRVSQEVSRFTQPPPQTTERSRVGKGSRKKPPRSRSKK